MNKAIILLSGGLDSVVSLVKAKEQGYNIELALTFNYGQKSVNSEISASKKVCEYYDIKHQIITLDWLKNITNTTLVSDKEIPSENFSTKESASSVWVPNRNSLFLNIAASYCDSYGYKYIIYGANKDEAQNFPDNTEEFRKQLSKVFKNSTLVKPTIIAPLIKYTKSDIVRIAIEGDVPIEFIRSCYNSGDTHCGKCESCYHLKKALLENKCDKYLKILFNDEN